MYTGVFRITVHRIISSTHRTKKEWTGTDIIIKTEKHHHIYRIPTHSEWQDHQNYEENKGTTRLIGVHLRKLK